MLEETRPVECQTRVHPEQLIRDSSRQDPPWKELRERMVKQLGENFARHLSHIKSNGGGAV